MTHAWVANISHLRRVHVLFVNFPSSLASLRGKVKMKEMNSLLFRWLFTMHLFSFYDIAYMKSIIVYRRYFLKILMRAVVFPHWFFFCVQSKVLGCWKSRLKLKVSYPFQELQEKIKQSKYAQKKWLIDLAWRKWDCGYMITYLSSPSLCLIQISKLHKSRSFFFTGSIRCHWVGNGAYAPP